MRAYTAGTSVPGTNVGMATTSMPAGRMLVTRRKFRLAMPASMSAQSNAVSSVRPSPLPATIETALGRSHMQDSPPPTGNACPVPTRLVRGPHRSTHLPRGYGTRPHSYSHPPRTAPAPSQRRASGVYAGHDGGTLMLEDGKDRMLMRHVPWLIALTVAAAAWPALPPPAPGAPPPPGGVPAAGGAGFGAPRAPRAPRGKRG